MGTPGTSYWPADTSAELLDQTIGTLLHDAAADSPDRLALVDGRTRNDARRSWTYSEVLRTAEQIARALLRDFSPGDRIAIWAPNSPEWVLFQLGAGMAGVTLVTANPAYQRREIEYVLEKSRSVGLFVAEEYRGRELPDIVASVREANEALRSLKVIRERDWDAFVRSGDPATALPVVSADSPVQIQFTSGTTGNPKAVILHHRGTINASRLATNVAGMRPGYVWVNVMPLFHVGGCVFTGLGVIGNRGTHVVVPEFDAGEVLRLFEELKGNIGLLVPTMLVRLLAHPDLGSTDLNSVKVIVSGASTVAADLILQTKQAFGCDFSNVFGQTEVSCVCAATGPADTPEDQAATIGRPIPHVAIKIQDPVSGETAELGQEGEICARGYQIMTGYLEDPEADASSVDAQGWLHTGDLGSMDERGYLKVTGRLKDMIIRGGENISPREVEELLFRAPGVAEAVVVGIPDPEWGECVAAAIRPTSEEDRPTVEELTSFCREHVAKFKVPSIWRFVDSYPLTPSGKIQKFVLREQITTELAKGRTGV